MKKQLATLFTILITGLVTAQTNYNKASFDFENGSPENWTQVRGFSSSTEQVASGKKSMKADFPDYASVKGNGPKLQSFRGKNVSPGKFNIAKGTYTVSVKVYIEGEVPRYLSISLSGKPKVVAEFQKLDGLEVNKWHTLTTTINVDEDSKGNWLSISFFALPKSGSGAVYIDDLSIVSAQ
ncbi:carbohydrate binding domain-containing protein [Wenyingzhuangia aestuarii]|uniref:hypothetical protein n=1 Tax=Wenyingzhuangia aestuarii TaxID=1647582 RepID=UPI00143C801B|nr:hypothetical protein [Wenyingzhuangia aestuarii]NJB83564.1 hypothetical protein [Wenyingzhuangia aestuarii]